MLDIRIKAKNVSPLCQIDSNQKERHKNLGMEIDTATIKTLTKIYEGYPVDIPIITAGDRRGNLRRVIGALMIMAYKNKGYEIKPTDFHLMMSGGGSNFQSQPFEIEEKARELNPLISLMGTSLAIEGKLIVTHLEPIDPMIKIYETEDGFYARSQLIRKFVFIKKDDILQHTEYGRLLNKKDIEEWEKEVSESQNLRKKERKILDESKTKKQAIQSILAKYYIIPNTEFRGNIDTKYELTELEYGALIKGLIEMTKKQVGSTKNLGFGVMDWDIKIGESEIKAVSNEENIFKKEMDIYLDDKEQKALKKFEEFLENISPESIEISKILISKS